MSNDQIITPHDLRGATGRLQRLDETPEKEKLALLCIRKAQELKETDLEFTARYEYIKTCTYIQKPDQAIAMFPWLLRNCDENRDKHRYFLALWAYKWILSSVKEYATVPLSRMEEMLRDMEERYRDFGSGEKVIHYLKFLFYSETGNALADEEFRLYEASNDYGRLDDCHACQPACIADHFMGAGQYEKVLEIIDPIVRGELRCHAVPETTFHVAMICCMMLGRWEEADHYCRLSRRRLKLNTAEPYAAGSHLAYYGITGDFIKGRTVFEKQFPFILENLPHLLKFEFFIGAEEFFRRMLASGRKNIRLSIPENALPETGQDGYALDRLVQLTGEMADKMAEMLDLRNRNSFYSVMAERLRKTYAALSVPAITP